jgi:alanine-synthesizing transaminase
MMPFHFSSRTHWNLASNALALKVAELKRAGMAILDLTESNPTRCRFDYPEREILAALARTESLLYEPIPRGLATARNAVCNYYQTHSGLAIYPEHVFLTASTSEAYSFAFRLLADPGDEILIPRPSYPLFDFLARLNDVSLHEYSLEYHNGWHVDFSSLERSVTSRTRAILVVNPNNPTGSGIRDSERERLLSLCRDRQLALISDEVFLDFEFTAGEETPSGGGLATRPERLRSLAGNMETLILCLSGISKMLGLPQLKLAWMAASGPAEWLHPALERLEVIADTFLSVGTPVQHALALLLEKAYSSMRSQILNRVRSNLRTLDDRVARCSGLCERLSSQGGWSAVVSIPRTRSEEDWVLRWLAQDQVLVHPGYFFDFEQEGFLVVSLLPPPDLFREGIERLFSRIEQDMKI